MRASRLLLTLLFAGSIMVSCKAPKGEKTEAGEAEQIQQVEAAIEYTVNTETSKIDWVGTKPAGQHNGVVFFKEGTLEVKDGELVGGKVIIDFKTINNLDIEDPQMRKTLVDDLKSPNFFNVDSFPTGAFEIASVEKIPDTEAQTGEVKPTHKITGNLTMKGVTKSITFDAVISMDGDNLMATTPQFLINRTEWNIKYMSRSFYKNLKDNFVHDDLAITITLNATKTMNEKMTME